MSNLAIRPVGRPKAFDETQVLEAALEVFWEKGFAATSLTDLVRATGLHKGSLYQSFGDKESLFFKAFQHYAAITLDEAQQAAAGHRSPLAALYSVSDCMLERAAGKTGCTGCMAVNTMIEIDQHGAAVETFIAEGYAVRIDIITQLLTQAQQAGEISDAFPPGRLAMLFMTTMMGVATGLRAPLDVETARQVVRDMLQSWQ